MRQNEPPPHRGQDPWGAFGYLVAGVGLYGGLGWLGDHYFRTSFLVPVGILLGLALALYLVFKRYGHNEPKDDQ